jgi:S-adenosylmethionine:tRNA ribosyltransferase-isomerase
MHKEYFNIPKETAEVIMSTKKSKKKVIAIGTTVARTLEYANKLITQCSENISGEADIFIYPGYEFKIIDGLLTNYHAPKSTVLMLTAAFAGWDNLMKAYEHAKEKGYKFLSYGDSMLIL